MSASEAASATASASANGIGLGGALFLLFLGLKLTGYIAWSLWWVTAPLWVPAVMFLGAFGVILGVAGCLAIAERRGKKALRKTQGF